jgi:phage-related protein
LLPWVTTGVHRRKIAIFIFLAWLNLHAMGTKMFQWTSPVDWAETAREIRAAEARVRQTGGSETVTVRTAAWGFDFDLTVNPATARRDGLF